MSRSRTPQEDSLPPSLDASAVRAWSRLSLRALGRAREEIDAINVYPVADGDTGTNLYLTWESAAQAVEAAFDGHAATGAPDAAQPRPTLAETLRALAHGALIGARGNSGTILAQLLRGLSQSLTGPAEGAAVDGTAADGTAVGSAHAGGADADALRRALPAAARSAYEAVARPVEGTMLTVAAAAAEAALQAGGGLDEVVRAAHDAALAALAATPTRLGALRRAGVVDAGGLGLVAVLGALCEAVTGERPLGPVPGAASGAGTSFLHGHPLPDGAVDESCPPDGTGPAFEVIYLLEAPSDARMDGLRRRLDRLGESLVVVGGDGLWHVHVHVDDVGAAIEAGIEAGRPHRIRVTHFAGQARAFADQGRASTDRGAQSGQAGQGGAFAEQGRAPRGEPAARAVVAVVQGEGLAALCARAGATVVCVRPGEAPASGEIAAAIRRAHAREVVVLPNDVELRDTAAAAAEQARADGVRVALIPTRCEVQGLAALAVHEASRRFDEDVVAMTSAAGATRYAQLAVAERESWTMAGVCQAGDVLGLIDGDVALIGADLADTAAAVLDRMLAAGGELVTLVPGDTAPADLVPGLERHVREAHLAVDTVTYDGGTMSPVLMIGVE